MKRLIAVDGLDGCGKDSHAASLRDMLRDMGVEVDLVTHPSTRLTGRLSKRFLHQTGAVPRMLATVFFTADVLVSVGRFNRMRDGTVIFVRYLLGTAYLPRRLAPAGYEFFTRLLPFPDIALFIDILPEKAIERIEARDHRREMFETLSKLREVREIALTLVDEKWTVIDNTEDGGAPFEASRRAVADKFGL